MKKRNRKYPRNSRQKCSIPHMAVSIIRRNRRNLGYTHYHQMVKKFSDKLNIPKGQDKIHSTLIHQ